MFKLILAAVDDRVKERIVKILLEKDSNSFNPVAVALGPS